MTRYANIVRCKIQKIFVVEAISHDYIHQVSSAVTVVIKCPTIV